MTALCIGLTGSTGAAAAYPPAPRAATEPVCNPVSGTKTFESATGYTRALARTCTREVTTADGGKAVQATLEASFQYYWGLAWHSEAADACSVMGKFEMRKGSLSSPPEFRSFGGSCGKNGTFTATVQFPVGAGTYLIWGSAEKTGGYYQKNTESSQNQDYNTNYIHIRPMGTKTAVR